MAPTRFDNSTQALVEKDGNGGHTPYVSSGGGVAGTPAGGVQSVQGVAGGTPVRAGGTTVATSATLTRPSNTNAYAQYDIVAAQASGVSVIFLQFSGIARVANGSGYIVKARLETNRSTEAGSYRLFLYRKTALNLASPPTNLGDNDLFPMLYANRNDRIGYIDFATWATGGSGSDSSSCQVTDLRLAFGCDTLETSLYGLLTANAAVTPASAQQFQVYLSSEQN